jgi:hypothetical protein
MAKLELMGSQESRVLALTAEKAAREVREVNPARLAVARGTVTDGDERSK